MPRQLTCAVALALLASTAACRSPGAESPAPAPPPETQEPPPPAKADPKAQVDSDAEDESLLDLYASAIDRPNLDRPELGSLRTEKESTGKGTDWFVAPIPFRDDQVGWGLQLWGGAIIDSKSEGPDARPSTVGAGGFYAENESWAALFGGRFYPGGGDWRITGATGVGVINYNFYGIGGGAGGGSIPLTSEFSVLFLEALKRVRPGLFVGPAITYLDVQSDLQSGGAPPVDPDQADTGNTLLGLHLTGDWRDNEFWPRTGNQFETAVDAAAPGLGSEFQYQLWDVAYKHYFPVDESVIATHLQLQAATGDTPFFAVPSLSLRGYGTGRYQNELVLLAQAEYRVTLWRRLGAVVFGGLGQTAANFSDLDTSDVLPAVGAGLRIRLTKKNPLNYRIDVGWGNDGQPIVYLALGEAF